MGFRDWGLGVWGVGFRDLGFRVSIIAINLVTAKHCIETIRMSGCTFVGAAGGLARYVLGA